MVAEQQLQVPIEWIRDDDDAMAEQEAPPLGNPLQFSQEERAGSKVHILTGANGLHVEVGLIVVDHAMPDIEPALVLVEVGCDIEMVAVDSYTCGLQVNSQTGSLDRWEVGGHSLLAQGIAPCLFRAPLDNDLGGSGKTSFASR